MQRQYLCINIKSLYASVECVQRGLDPMTAKLVVANPEHGKNTICLAISPALKALGVQSRCRLGDIPAGIRFITARPQMKLYSDRHAEIYRIYLKYFSRDDIHAYSVDEAFMDATNYLTLYGKTARELAATVTEDIRQATGLRAVCGIGTNLYLTKTALDIVAGHSPELIGELDEETYRETLWDHRPLTDFWRIGPGISARLARCGMFTMRDIAKTDKKMLFNMFGKDAAMLIDHAWGREKAAIADLKAYRSSTGSLSSRQTLMRDCNYEEGSDIVKEMTELLCLDLTGKGLVTNSLSLSLIYSGRDGETAAKGRISLAADTNSNDILIPAAAKLYEQISVPHCRLLRVAVCFGDVAPEDDIQPPLLDNAGENVNDAAVPRKASDGKSRFVQKVIFEGMNMSKAAATPEHSRLTGQWGF